MRSSLFLVVLALAMISGSFRSGGGQVPARTEQLFADLQNERTSDGAAVQLLQDGKESAETRAYLAAHLPSLIENLKAPHVWLNSVRLAGSLRIGEAVPGLARLLNNDNTQGEGGYIDFHRTVSLEGDPPGKALAQIGDPAVPEVAKGGCPSCS